MASLRGAHTKRKFKYGKCNRGNFNRLKRRSSKVQKNDRFSELLYPRDFWNAG